MWLDICTVVQNPTAQVALPADYFYTAFTTGIESIGTTVLSMIPLFQPVPVTRAWCVWEIYATLSRGSMFETALTPKDQSTRDSHSIVRRMEVNIESAKAFMQSTLLPANAVLALSDI